MLRLLLLVLIIVLLNVVLSRVFFRLDLTQEKRYSLSTPTKELLEEQSDIVFVTIYLAGDLTPNMQQLQTSTVEMLKQFKAYGHDNIQWEIQNPFDITDEVNLGKFIQELEDRGVYSIPFGSADKEQTSRSFLFPYANVNYKGKDLSLLLLDQVQPLSPLYDPTSAISLLEYKFSKSIRLLSETKRPDIAFIEGQNELDTLEVQDIAISLSELYNMYRIDLPNSDYIDTLYDVVVIAKPRSAFSEEDKYKLDQYLMYGGRILWLIDPVIAEFDSLRSTGEFTSVDYPLDIMDQLIQYGARVNNNIIQDKQCSHIKVPYGNTFQDRPWLYNPVITGFNKQHPISANIDAVEAKFVSSIDTTAVPGIRKTILLTTSANSRFLMSPARINYNIVQSQYMPTDEQFNKPNLPVAVLLEGEFPSAFSTRKPTAKAMERRRLGNGPYAERSIPTKQIVVSDGDMIRNYVDADGKIYPLGANNIERYIFGNKDFLMNCIEYLTDNTGLMETRAKEVKLRPIDKEQVEANRTQWQLINIGAPVLLIYLFSGIYNYIRNRKYA
ncbi:MAG: gliding motility-associated ABC transporter substrate-binding protein GldG [Chitinophagales bacterium]|nr:gliding motility-associated ABC transporter substrate-binding protein GldG [Chitinophagales bacterium]MCB9032163.1 gliding motility-associated ABC transporter substrate-binding protein GldG [Chitinophagales bacterium]HPE98890.1 gliding motility-associated ABC transporter substrate-binding protein GldG [Chitinophagales bacterium]